MLVKSYKIHFSISFAEVVESKNWPSSRHRFCNPSKNSAVSLSKLKAFRKLLFQEYEEFLSHSEKISSSHTETVVEGFMKLGADLGVAINDQFCDGGDKMTNSRAT